MDNLISDLIARRNWAQARKAIEKKLKQKKYEENNSLIIAKATVQQGLGEYKTCLDLCTQLCQKKVPVQDFDDVTNIYALLRQLCHHVPVEEAVYEKLWRGAVMAQSKGKLQRDWAEEWAEQATKQQHWTLLTRAAMTLRQLVSSGSSEWRKYSFMMITAQWMASISTVEGLQTPGDERMKTLLGTLATRQLDDAIKNIQGTPNSSNRLRMEKLSELKLFTHIAQALGDHGKIIEAVDADRAGKLGRGDEDIAVVQLDAMLAASQKIAASSEDDTTAHADGAVGDDGETEVTEKWTTLEACEWFQDIIEANGMTSDGALQLDDWTVWKELVKLHAAYLQESQPEEVAKLTESMMETIHNHGNITKTARAPRLAEFQIQCSQGTSKRQTAFVKHFERNSAQGFIVDDLSRQMEGLDMQTFKGIRDAILQLTQAKSISTMQGKEQLDWIISEINTMKLDLLYLQRANEPSSDTLLSSLITNALRLYALSLTLTTVLHEKADHPGDEAALVAIDALLTLGRRRNTIDLSILQSLCLLDHILTSNKHNFLARTHLTALLQTFALYPLAATSFRALDVKEILHENISPLLFLRIGSLGVPSSTTPPPRGAFDSYDAMSAPLSFFAKSVSKIPDYQTLAFDHENYSQVIFMSQFREQLRLSPTRLMLLFERRRIVRITRRAIPASNARVEEQELANSLREVYTGSAEVARRAQPDRKPGPQMCRQYTEWLMVVDLAFELAVGEQVDGEAVKAGYVTFTRLVGMLQERGTGDGVLTPTELDILKAASAVMAVLLHITGASPSTTTSSSSSLPTIDAALNTLTTISIRLRDTPTHRPRPSHLDILPTWETYHESYLSLELSLVLAGLSAKLASPKLPVSVPSSPALKALAASLFAAVQESFSGYKGVVEELADGGAEMDGLVRLVTGGAEEGTEDEVGWAVREVVGERNVKRMVLGYVQGARGAVDAVLSVKMGK